jgi:tetratricopeptide (TPR) repeat protein
LVSRAANLAQRAIDYDAANHAYQFTLGLAKYRQGDFEEANKWLQRAMGLAQGDGRNYLLWQVPKAEYGPREERRRIGDVGSTVAPCFLAMSCFRLGEEQQARKLLLYAERRSGLLSVLPPSLDTAGLNREETRPLLALREAHSLIARENPALTDQQWVERALAFQEETVEHDQDDWPAAEHLAILYLWFGKDGEHRELCEQLLESARQSEEVTVCRRACHPYLINDGTNDPQLLKLAVTLSRRAVEFQNGTTTSAVQLVRGMAEYRQGSYAQAQTWLTEAIRSQPEVRGVALLFRAMANHQLTKTNAARADFEAAGQVMKPMGDRTKLTADILSTDDLVFWIVYSEAEELLDSAAPPQQ